MLPRKGSQWKLIKRDFVRNRVLYLMVLPVLAFYIIFSYVPMFGVIIAFKDYSPAKGILGSPFTDMYGLRHFADFMTSPFFGRLIRNTVLISLYSLVFAFPAPILFALLLNELQNKMFKRITQTISYFPHFVSLVVVCGMLTDFSLSDGLFNQVRAVFGLEAKSLLQETAYFRTIYVSSGVWKEVGWGSIIYLAAIAGIDSQLYEAAALDGAGRLRSTVHITLPSIKPTIVILFIMQVGNMLSVGSEKIILLQNPATLEVADVISSYVYRRGLLEFSWSFSSAVGLFNSIINFALVFMANGISRKLTESSLF
ncbi:MAG: ABC transporter permease [Christensenellales bacterium]